MLSVVMSKLKEGKGMVAHSFPSFLVVPFFGTFDTFAMPGILTRTSRGEKARRYSDSNFEGIEGEEKERHLIH